MRVSLIIAALIISTVVFFAFTTYPGKYSPLSSEEDIVEAAHHFISLLNEEQKNLAVFPFETDERTFWHFVPMTGERKGLSLQDMDETQRIALHALLQSTLSSQGYLKVTSIQQLERLLGEITNRSEYRNPGFYYLTIFGDPSLNKNWGWRYEGHHLSMSITMVDGEISVTPSFYGTNPGQVRETIFAGLEVLGEEIGIARQLMQSFNESQQKKALISEKAPREIITGNDRVAMLDHFEGLSYTEMNETQQRLLMLLVTTYANNLEGDIAMAQLDRIHHAGIEQLYFAWAGSTSPTEGHYFRIHGPKTLIEYDNTQNNANHVHTVWRDLENDFGRDLLRNHYENSDHSH